MVFKRRWPLANLGLRGTSSKKAKKKHLDENKENIPESISDVLDHQLTVEKMIHTSDLCCTPSGLPEDFSELHKAAAHSTTTDECLEHIPGTLDTQVDALDEPDEDMDDGWIDDPEDGAHAISNEGLDEENDVEVWEGEDDEATDTEDITGEDDYTASRPRNFKPTQAGNWIPAPDLDQIKAAYDKLNAILKPRRKKGYGHQDPGLDRIVRERFEAMSLFCFHAIDLQSKNPGASQWTKASELTAKSLRHGKYQARQIRQWTRNFIADPKFVPQHNWKGGAGRSHLEDEDFAQEIHLHLQTLGAWVCAKDIVDYVARPEVLEKLGRRKTISLATAQRWMSQMGYRWTRNPRGQYVDGHERSDVVKYRNEVFLPTMAEIEPFMRKWKQDGTEEEEENPPARRKVVWVHDESTYYAHDRRNVRWVHKSENAIPYTKGEGHSLMVAAFVSADYGWIGVTLFKAGKNRDGYFDNDDVRKQFGEAMTYVKERWPNDDHEFAYDNAKTHTKRAETALSALKMPKGPSSVFGVDVNVIGPNGKPVYDSDGKIKKQRVRMANGKLPGGQEQQFYFPEGHERAGDFKGMALILEERGFAHIAKKKAQCGRTFKSCPEGVTDCCCRRFLYNQPDFAKAESLLELDAKANGFRVFFLPKFHCELNFIEQCWGYAKRRYRMYPLSSKEEDLERNLLQSLEEVTVIEMRRFARRSLRFMDAYRKGLDGAQAAWAAKKYRGHRTIPENILSQLDTLMASGPQQRR